MHENSGQFVFSSSRSAGTPFTFKYLWGSVYKLGKGEIRTGEKKKKGKRRKGEKWKRRIGEKQKKGKGEKQKRGTAEKEKKGKGEKKNRGKSRKGEKEKKKGERRKE